MDDPDESDRIEPIPEPRHIRGERGRHVPRSAWWILGLAAALFLVFAVVRPAWFTKSPEGAPLRVPAERHFAQTLGDLGRADGLWLTNETPSASFAVTLPMDSHRDVTRIKLVGSTQVAEESTVFLIVAFDGQQVFERQLPRGEHPFEATLAVPERIAEDGRVRIQVRARGVQSHLACTPDQLPGMVVHLDSSSVLEAALDDPLHTVRDVAAALNRDVTVVLADPGEQWLTVAAGIGMGLTRAGHRVTYTTAAPSTGPDGAIFVGPESALTERLRWKAVGGGDSLQVGTVDKTPVLGVVQPTRPEVVSRMLTTPALATADASTAGPEALVATHLAGDQVGLERLGTDLSEIEITESHSWRSTYSLADLPGGRLPRAVRLDVRLPAAPDDLTWLVNTSLNGTLLDSRRLARNAPPVEIPLPPGAHLLDNELTVSIQRDRDLGGCDVRVAGYPLQIAPGSALLLGDDPGSGFTSLPRAFAAGPTVYLLGDDDEQAGLLNAVVPVLSDFTGWDRYPPLKCGGPPEPGKPFVLIGPPDSVATPLRLDDGRVLAGGRPVLDLDSPQRGNVVQCATGANGAVGLAVSPIGDPGSWQLPGFGRECAQVITPGGNFAVVGAGEVYVSTPSRAGTPR
ncbi:hypothetical protein VST63_01690 [Mycolicibacterium sp. 050232]|uniref:hypothetical protein n=1 Tax=Mycolicibacterium sp. 050232 TaxID=3113982 RepID=UPI002E2D28B7|nr:hypothetical protein [Mycolicibacterium sp. 050232]MED5811060.1 hypothetical protein [Mycolicibacterium sp. 050232]